MTIKKNRILFRTSGGNAPKKQLGMGHIFRCINLAKMFKNEQIFFLVEDYGSVKETLLKNNFKNIISMKTDTSTKLDINQTLNVINEERIDIVIIDKFNLRQKFVKDINSKIKTVVISDLDKINYESDLTVNGFVGLKNEIRMNKFNKKCFLGPKYQILDHRFGKNTKLIKPKFDLIVTMGGFDEKDIIITVLNVLKNFNGRIKSKIILGPATKKSSSLKRLEKELQGSIKIVQQTSNMKKEISSAKFGICSGGITSYEFATMNVPFAIISQVKHQTKTAKQWEKLGIAHDLGMVSAHSPEKIKRFIEKIIHNECLMEKHHNIVDGGGSKRIQNEIILMLKN